MLVMGFVHPFELTHTHPCLPHSTNEGGDQNDPGPQLEFRECLSYFPKGCFERMEYRFPRMKFASLVGIEISSHMIKIIHIRQTSQGLPKIYNKKLAFVSNLAKYYLNQFLMFLLGYLYTYVTCKIFLKQY